MIGRSLSAVIPAYNEEAYIEKCVAGLETALKRVAERFEIIVVDDGSTDRTADILESLARDRPHLVVVHHRQNQGLGRTLRSRVRPLPPRRLISPFWTHYAAYRAIADTPLYWSLLAAGAVLRTSDESQARRLHAADLERSLVATQVDVLKMTLQPHFLFNTLNSSQFFALERDNDAVVTMVTRLADLLRTRRWPRAGNSCRSTRNWRCSTSISPSSRWALATA